MQPMTFAKQASTFVCPYCTDTVTEARKRRREHSGAPPPLKLREVTDAEPPGAAALHHAKRAILEQLTDWEVTELPGPSPLTDDMIQQAVECCRTAIATHTFSESYPLFCLREQQAALHAYLQGATVATRGGPIVSFSLSNGMDPYGNLKTTITQLRSHLTRNKSARPAPGTKEILDVTDISDFVHVTLIATHHDCRGKGLAKMLLLLDLVRWALRGRRRAFLNMALEKSEVNGKSVCGISAASRALYEGLGFVELYPRFEDDGTHKFTRKEEDLGRVMVNPDIAATVLKAVASITSPPRRRVLRLKK